MSTSLSINMLVAGMPFDGETIYKTGLGGSETAGYYVAKELARRGHRVSVFTNTDKISQKDGVVYIPLSHWQLMTQANDFDVSIVQRVPDVYQEKNRGKLHILWQHDLGAVRVAGNFCAPLWNIDSVFVVSDYHKEQLTKANKIPEYKNDLFHVARNGIDLDLINSSVKRKPFGERCKNVIWAARPERGLDVLLLGVMPRLLKAIPDLKLHIASYAGAPEHLTLFYDKCKDAMRQFGDSVVDHGTLSKKELYRLYGRCGAYLYTTPSPGTLPNFYEVSCISAMEAQATGTPFITTDRGALRETIHKDAGILIPYERSDEFLDEFAAKTIEVLTDQKKWESMSKAGIDHAKSLDWSLVVDGWEQKIFEMFDERTSNVVTLAEYLISTQDIIAAKELVKRNEGNEKLDKVKKYLSDRYQFVDDNDYQNYYRDIVSPWYDVHYAKDTYELPDVDLLDQWIDLKETRYCKWLRDLKSALGRPPEILEIGPNEGAYSILGANMGANITSFDFNEKSENYYKPIAAKFLKDGAGKINRHYGDKLSDSGITGKYDAVVVMDVLEHIPDHSELINEVEDFVKPGGQVFVTVPYGSNELVEVLQEMPAQHIWHFDSSDLRDIFGKKDNCQLFSVPGIQCPITGNPAGTLMVIYNVPVSGPKKETGKINIDRKLRIQNPVQSVSACLLGGPNSEETLEWCLKSVASIAKEIIIVDCGLSDLAKFIAKRYNNLKIVPGDDPKKIGFEEARNIGLSHCVGDWILWIDTDEKILEPINVRKYLRKNCFDAYSIKQHHFSVDANFGFDIPARMFRNDGTIKFYGVVHEHPEKALNEGPGFTAIMPDSEIAHVGYLKESTRRARFKRNWPLMEKDLQKYPDRILQKHLLMRDKILLAHREIELHNGQVTNNVRKYASEVIELWRKYFRGKQTYNSSDPIEHYSEACRILELGFEVNMALSADKFDAKYLGQQRKVRYANMEDFKADLLFRAESVAADYEREDY